MMAFPLLLFEAAGYTSGFPDVFLLPFFVKKAFSCVVT